MPLIHKTNGYSVTQQKTHATYHTRGSFAAMKQLPTDKAPGIESISTGFFQEMWEDIEPNIYNYVTRSISQADILEELNISKIILLPKFEDRLRI